MKSKNPKRMLKIYSLVLATSLTICSCRENLNKNNTSENIHEYSWTGGVLSKDELIHKKKDEKGKFLRRKK